MPCRNLLAMPFTRIVIPLICVAIAFAGIAGCGGGSGSASATATATTTVTACAGCTALPTATPTAAGTPTPTPSSYQPLATGDQWNYTCTSGAATKSVSANGSMFNDQLSLPASVLPTTLTAVESNDALGNTDVSQWILGASTTNVSPAGVEYGPTVISSGSTPYQAPVIGTITTTYNGTSTVNVPYGSYNNVPEFKAVDSSPVFPALGEIDVYAVLGVGPIEIVLPDATTPQTCVLNTAVIH